MSLEDASTDVITWSLITVSFNSAEALGEFWGDFPADLDVEWIVVDNNSTDASAEIAATKGAKVIRLPENRGFGAANNVGFRASKGRYVAFVNPDVRVDLDDLGKLGEFLSSQPKALVSPQLLNPGGEPQPNGRGLPYLLSKVRNRTAPDTLVGSYLLFAGVGEALKVRWLMGAVVAGCREHLASLGPWDERFFVYYEDSDLGLRNESAGGESFVIGDARWVHGWARETTRPSVTAWKRELPSMTKFYSRYPRLLGWPKRGAPA